MGRMVILVDDEIKRALRAKYGHGDVADLVRDYLKSLVEGAVQPPKPSPMEVVNRVARETVKPQKFEVAMNPMMRKFIEQHGEK